jgi:hypothetical protein
MGMTIEGAGPTYRLTPAEYEALCAQYQEWARRFAVEHDFEGHSAFHMAEDMLHKAAGSLRPVPCFCPNVKDRGYGAGEYDFPLKFEEAPIVIKSHAERDKQ